MKASLIIPAYNACERLYYNLLLLNKQDYPTDKFEVILINNGSTDDTVKMLAGFKANYKLTVIKLPANMSRAYARNKGILEAKNELIIFHDSDMLANKDFVRKHIESHTKDRLVVCGKLWSKIYTYYYKDFTELQKKLFNKHMSRYVKNKEIKPLVDKKAIIRKNQIDNGSYVNYHFDVDLYYNQVLNKYGNNLDGFNFEWLFCVTRNCSIKKDSLLEVGLFDESFIGNWSEDTDLGYKLFEKGCKLIVNPNIISIHQEHARSSADTESIQANRAILIKKHNSINLLFFFLYRHFGLNSIELNNAMSDINNIRAKLGENELVLLFQNGLIDLRNKLYSNITPQAPKSLDKESISKGCTMLNQEFNATNFVNALVKMLKVNYGIQL